MITKDTLNDLEQQIMPYVQKRKLKSGEAHALLDQYWSAIEQFFKQCNHIEEKALGDLSDDTLDALPVVPMNFKERYDYILQRKYHFMGFKQMQTMKNELIKMNAAYLIRTKHQQKRS
ncbi:YpoC family protein [Staphylococcus auricularis]|uniref:YpoC-like domain-containing protein n=1 Tax=Staphylococcus auricularis TaxID=29379 RepID=A0ABX5IEH8_9STAP|nr:hypothetical protein [Staphylococcus auricularis]PTH17611.1 hypothetical protein BU607_07320 [Staphylococcus auricularis]PTH26830.1 hypothetical protein BU608_02960 [Staphylococcus auricularis]